MHPPLNIPPYFSMTTPLPSLPLRHSIHASHPFQDPTHPSPPFPTLMLTHAHRTNRQSRTCSGVTNERRRQTPSAQPSLSSLDLRHDLNRTRLEQRRPKRTICTGNEECRTVSNLLSILRLVQDVAAFRHAGKTADRQPCCPCCCPLPAFPLRHRSLHHSQRCSNACGCSAPASSHPHHQCLHR